MMNLQADAAGGTGRGEMPAHLWGALRGDPDEFNELTAPYRGELRVHCYRILGSLTEAEDMVQETFLRAWKRLGTYQGRSSFRAWLYKIATNLCLDELDKRRSRRLLPVDQYPPADAQTPIAPPAAEAAWLEPFPDEWLPDPGAINPEARYSALEGVSLAFLAALQTLPPRQRAVLILSDVLEWSAQDVADLLGASASAVASALHRARASMQVAYHGRAPETTGVPADERTRQVLDRYVQAWRSADVNGLVRLLTEEAALSMPPSPAWYRGRRSIRAFAAATIFAEGGMFGGAASGRWRLQPTRANGQPAFVVYQRMEGEPERAVGVQVLSLGPRRIHEVICFLDPELARRFERP